MRDRLLDTDRITAALTHDAPWCDSHGADGDYLGGGLLYYAIVYALRCELAVCLGSGGGFVPRMMRQAQRDAGIGHRARTVLVDGDVPEAGWGAPTWTGPQSFFRRAFADVEIVLEHTSDAATSFFAARDLRIDYLHIDADHSFEGCLQDFVTYRPLLRDGALVTLHDTNFPGAGVRTVIDRLRARSDCDVIDLTELGVGTAIVRVRGDGGAIGERTAGGPDHAVRAVRRPDAPPFEPPATAWSYLEAEAFTTRSVLAAHFVAGCPTVVEIGGYRTPIDRFLTGTHESVLVVDPLIRDATRDELNGAPCVVDHMRARFQDLWWQILRPGDYGLVILGLEIQGLSAQDEQVLYELVDGARVTVLEFPSSWHASCAQYAQIRANTSVIESLRAGLDLSGNDVGDLAASWAPRFDRELHVLRRRA
jgi:hypothetical protein